MTAGGQRLIFGRKERLEKDSLATLQGMGFPFPPDSSDLNLQICTGLSEHTLENSHQLKASSPALKEYASTVLYRDALLDKNSVNHCRSSSETQEDTRSKQMVHQVLNIRPTNTVISARNVLVMPVILSHLKGMERRLREEPHLPLAASALCYTPGRHGPLWPEAAGRPANSEHAV